MDIAERISLALVGRQDVRLAYLFGSTAAGAARADRDVDVAILSAVLTGHRVLSTVHSNDGPWTTTRPVALSIDRRDGICARAKPRSRNCVRPRP